MQGYHLDNQTITTFNQRTNNNNNEDTTEYVFDLDISIDNTIIATVVSDNRLVIYDCNTLQQYSAINAHSNNINTVKFTLSPNICITCSDDGSVKQWDTRCINQPVLTFNHQEEINTFAVGMSDSLLAVGCESSILFYDVRNTSTQQQDNEWQKSLLLGEYSDTHSDIVTALSFSSSQSNILASASEDGLLCIYNTSAPPNSDAIISIMNSDNSIRKIGYFGPGNEGIYTISNTETMSMWHYNSAQRISHFPSIRETLGVDYLVDCIYHPTQESLYLVAGHFNGSGIVATVEPMNCFVTGQLQDGHINSIRCCKAITNNEIPKIITGGEDSRLCSWVTNGSVTNNSNINNTISTFGASKSHKINSNLRHRPY